MPPTGRRIVLTTKDSEKNHIEQLFPEQFFVSFVVKKKLKHLTILEKPL